MNTYFKKRFFIVAVIALAFFILTPLPFTGCSTLEPQSPLPPITEIFIPEPQSPWPNINVYSDDKKKIVLNSGDEFIIKYTSFDLFPNFQKNYDDTKITLVKQVSDNNSDLTKKTLICNWFLFRAVGTGETQVEIIHYDKFPEWIEAKKVFTVVIK
jgi:hypothetical protein